MSSPLTPTHTLLPNVPDLYPYFTSTYTSTHQSINSPSASSFPSTNLKIVVSFTPSLALLSTLHFPSSILPAPSHTSSTFAPYTKANPRSPPIHPHSPTLPRLLLSTPELPEQLSSFPITPPFHSLRKGQIKEAT